MSSSWSASSLAVFVTRRARLRAGRGTTRWFPKGVDCLGRGTYLDVPRVDIVEFGPQTHAS